MTTKTNQGQLPAGVRNAPTTTQEWQAHASHSFQVSGDIDLVFGLLDPVSEREWVEEWDPQPIHPPVLDKAAGTIFTVERDGRVAVWTVLAHSAVRHTAEYLVCEHDYQHRWIEVNCCGADGTTTVNVRYVVTALSEQGQRDLGRYGESFLHAWQAPLQAEVDRRLALPG